MALSTKHCAIHLFCNYKKGSADRSLAISAISHISESAVLIENNLTQPKGVATYKYYWKCEKAVEVRRHIRREFQKDTVYNQCFRINFLSLKLSLTVILLFRV